MNPLVPPEAELRAAFQFVKSRPFPAIPDVIADITKELDKAEPSVSHLVELINSDMSLVGSMVKMIQSAQYGYTDVESIPQIISLIGLRQLRPFITNTYLQSALPLKSDYAKQLWEDSKMTAVLASKLAREFGTISPEEAYLAGLMLDSGAIFIAEKLPHDYHKSYRFRYDKPLSINQMEQRAIGINHSLIGYLFAKHWKLSEAICSVVYWHHNVPCNHIDDDELRTLLAIMKLAEYLTGKSVSTGTSDFSMENIQHLAKVKSELMITSERLAELEQLVFD